MKINKFIKHKLTINRITRILKMIKTNNKIYYKMIKKNNNKFNNKTNNL